MVAQEQMPSPVAGQDQSESAYDAVAQAGSILPTAQTMAPSAEVSKKAPVAPGPGSPAKSDPAAAAQTAQAPAARVALSGSVSYPTSSDSNSQAAAVTGASQVVGNSVIGQLTTTLKTANGPPTGQNNPPTAANPNTFSRIDDGVGSVNGDATGSSVSAAIHSLGVAFAQATGPDLTILSATAMPTSVKAGETVSVTWTLKNQGDQAITYESDSVYISADDVLDTSTDRLVTSYSLGSNFGPGATHEKNTTIAITGVTQSPCYIFIVADGNGQIAESDETNNVAKIAVAFTIPDVDLQIVNPQVSSTSARVNDTITLSWSVKNAGTDTTLKEWQDGAYLSKDDKLDMFQPGGPGEPGMGGGGDQWLIQSYHWQPLDGGASYQVSTEGATPTTQLKVGIPSVPAGDYYILIAVDRSSEPWGNNQQPESNENNNLVAIPIRLTTPAVDLQVSSPAAPATAELNASIAVSWTVANAGADPANGVWNSYQGQSVWQDVVYLSDDNVFNASQDQQLGSRNSDSPLASDATYRATANVTLPQGVVGAKYLFVVADGYRQQFDTNENNNVSAAIPIQINPPAVDLAITSATLSATTVRPTVGFNVNYTVTNQGAASASVSWVDYLYFSRDSVWDAADVQLETYSFSSPPLAANGKYDATRMVFLPAETPLGEGYILIVVNKQNSQVETNKTNNTKDLLLQVTKPDLQLLSVSAPASASPGETITVSWTAKNASSFRLGMLWDYVYLSSDNVLDSGDEYLTNDVRMSALEPNATYNASANYTFPASKSPGPYFLIVQVDRNNSVGDGDLTNNVKAVPFQLGKVADLVMGDFTAPAQVQLGQTFEVTWQVANQGEGAATVAWGDAIYLSDNALFEPASDTWVGSRWMSDKAPLAPGGSYTQTHPLTVPSFGLGNKYLLVVTDGGNNLAEGNETNNVKANPITLIGADLTVTTASSPASGILGQTVALTWTVKNQGNAATNATWYDYVYISDDQILGGDDSYVGFFDAPPDAVLAAGADYTALKDFVLPETRTGNRYLLYIANGGLDLIESDKANNVLAKPINLSAPDLTVTAVSAPAAAVLGQVLEVSWTVKNQGDSEAPADWLDGIYLSDDTAWDGSDAWVAWTEVSDKTPLKAGESYTITRNLTIATGTLGSKYLLFRANADGAQGEIDLTNNVRASAITLTAPDLVVSGLDAPAGAALSENVTISWTVRNQGTSLAPASWWDVFYLSPDNALGGNDIQLESFPTGTHSPLAAETSYEITDKVSIPSTIAVGAWYLFVVADGHQQQGETNETNNSRSVAITIGAADLAIVDATVPATASAGQTIRGYLDRYKPGGQRRRRRLV